MLLDRITGWITNSGAWAVRGHRVSHALWVGGHRHLAMIVMACARAASGAEIHPRARIGKGLALPHSFGVVIGWVVEIGDGCIIDQCVTLGLRRLDEPGQPRIGNRVFIGANAVLLGPITVGDGATVGAGAVVLEDVPAGRTAVGNPARLLPPKLDRSHCVGTGGLDDQGHDPRSGPVVGV